MIDSSNTRLEALAIHYCGNKGNGEELLLCSGQAALGRPETELSLIRYFTGHFRKPEFFRFAHSDTIALNTVYSICDRIFGETQSFDQLSASLARYLYEQSVHPQIKGGELYVALLSNCVLEDELTDAIGIFKTESKNRFFKAQLADGSYTVYEDSGVSEEKLDKACLVFRTEKEQGYKICIADTVSKGEEARYWKEDFLGLCPCDDAYHRTNNFLSLCKSYIKEQMPEEFAVEKTTQIDMLNKSVDFFKKHDKFDFQEFSKEVMQEPALVESFGRYKGQFEQQQQFAVEEQFDISETAVKKQAKFFKSILKLDKNFHIYIHGNREMIEKGFDEAKGLNYYKVFFREEG